MPSPLEMPETPYEVKARVLRQQKERTDEKMRQLKFRHERRDDIIRETVDQVRAPTPKSSTTNAKTMSRET